MDENGCRISNVISGYNNDGQLYIMNHVYTFYHLHESGKLMLWMNHLQRNVLYFTVVKSHAKMINPRVLITKKRGQQRQQQISIS